MSLESRTLRLLEWQRVTDALSERTRSPLGSSLAQNHRPLPSVEARNRMVRRTAEAFTLSEKIPIFPSLVSETNEPRPFFERSQKGGVLEPAEIFICGHFMETIGVLSGEFKGREDLAPLLCKDFELAPKRPALCDEIKRSVNSTGEILDSASSRLAELRRSRSHSRLAFEKFLGSRVKEWHRDGILQDDFYDVIDGRYVVPLKSGQTAALPGNLHSRSQTRQSLFIEPVEFVARNNELQEIDIQIRSEELRILRELTRKIAALAHEYMYWVEPVAELDLFFAAAKLSKDWKLFDAKPSLSLKLNQVFHPFLLAMGIEPVRNSFTLSNEGGESSTLVISGPNTGGKTVLIKAAALAALMAQAGLFAPVDEHSEIPQYTRVIALIGDDQNIAEGLSSFSSQIKDLKEVLQLNVGPMLVIVDEILSSTDPEEASSLSQAILEELQSRGHHVLVTTHFSQLATRCRALAGMATAAMEFHNGRPTYRLRLNELGASHALDVAERLQFPHDVLSRARGLMSSERINYEKALKALHEREVKLGEEHAARLRDLEEDYQRRLDELSRYRNDVEAQYFDFVERSECKLNETVAQLTDRIRTYERQGLIPAAKVAERATSTAKETTETLTRETKAQVDRMQGRASSGDKHTKARDPYEGATVRIPGLGNSIGRVVAIEGSQAVIQMGNMKLRQPVKSLHVVDSPKTRTEVNVYGSHRARGGTYIETSETVKSQLDLRGRRYDDAMAEAQRFLDEAFRSGLPQVKVITGHGTGALKAGFKDLLKDLPYIKKAEPDRSSSGATDDGAFVIDFEQ